MVTHTLVVSFPDDMSEADRARFFADGAAVVLGSGFAQSYRHWPSVSVPSAVGQSAFVASALVQIRCADVESMGKLFAHPALAEYAKRWRGRFPFQVVAVNTADRLTESDSRQP
jgi:hypothetical protein